MRPVRKVAHAKIAEPIDVLHEADVRLLLLQSARIPQKTIQFCVQTVPARSKPSDACVLQ
eukprot:m.1642921 g.1642921  ORF g.1642921 m.1642921 type:complete len:60 (-) comp55895_c0_seq1:102-281(-)